MADRVIREPNPETSIANRAVELPGKPWAVIGPVHPRVPIPAGDPYSESSTRVSFDELDADLQERLGGDVPAYGAPVQTIQNLRDVEPADREDKQMRLVEDAGAIYRFDTADTASPDDGDLIIAPTNTSAPDGRWFQTLVTPAEFAAHVADAAAHHSRYSDAEAVSAMGVLGDANPLHHNRPSSLPPSGAAGGDLSGTYPSPGVASVGGQTAATVGAHSAPVTGGNPHAVTAVEAGAEPAGSIATHTAIAAAHHARPVQATETVLGIAELATQVETDAGTDDARIVTPLKLDTKVTADIATHTAIAAAHHARPVQASETVLGIAELATQVETDAGADDLRIVTPLKLDTKVTADIATHTAIAAAHHARPVQASETVLGIAELATQVETDAGTDDLRIVTPLKLATRTATETRTGIAEIATQAETDAGTDDVRFVTPLKLATASQTKRHVMAFSESGGVPNGGTRYLERGGVAVTSAPVLLPAAAVLIGITVTVDGPAGTGRDYEIRVISDPGGADTLIGTALTLSEPAVSARRRDLSAAIGDGVLWGVVVVRVAGAGSSSFSDLRVELEVQMS